MLLREVILMVFAKYLVMGTQHAGDCEKEIKSSIKDYLKKKTNPNLYAC